MPGTGAAPGEADAAEHPGRGRPRIAGRAAVAAALALAGLAALVAGLRLVPAPPLAAGRDLLSPPAAAGLVLALPAAKPHPASAGSVLPVPVYALPSAVLAERVAAHALAEPGIRHVSGAPDRGGMLVVRRAGILGLPDAVLIRVVPEDSGRASLRVAARPRLPSGAAPLRAWVRDWLRRLPAPAAGAPIEGADARAGLAG